MSFLYWRFCHFEVSETPLFNDFSVSVSVIFNKSGESLLGNLFGRFKYKYQLKLARCRFCSDFCVIFSKFFNDLKELFFFFRETEKLLEQFGRSTHFLKLIENLPRKMYLTDFSRRRHLHITQISLKMIKKLPKS